MNPDVILDVNVKIFNAIYELVKNKGYLDEKIIEEFFDYSIYF